MIFFWAATVLSVIALHRQVRVSHGAGGSLPAGEAGKLPPAPLHIGLPLQGLPLPSLPQLPRKFLAVLHNTWQAL